MVALHLSGPCCCTVALRPDPLLHCPLLGSSPGALSDEDKGKKTLVLDLDETLVHSSFKPIPQPDYVIPVEIEGRIVDVYVLKRPFVDHFLRTVGHRFEVRADRDRWGGEGRGGEGGVWNRPAEGRAEQGAACFSLSQPVQKGGGPLPCLQPMLCSAFSLNFYALPPPCSNIMCHGCARWLSSPPPWASMPTRCWTCWTRPMW